jgi:hypothetical protein
MTAGWRARETVLRPRSKQNGIRLDAVGWWGSERARHGRKTPLLHIGLDKDETGLSKIDVNDARPVGSDCWEEVLRLQTVDDIL